MSVVCSDSSLPVRLTDTAVPARVLRQKDPHGNARTGAHTGACSGEHLCYLCMPPWWWWGWGMEPGRGCCWRGSLWQQHTLKIQICKSYQAFPKRPIGCLESLQKPSDQEEGVQDLPLSRCWVPVLALALLYLSDPHILNCNLRDVTLALWDLSCPRGPNWMADVYFVGFFQESVGN